MASQNSQSTAVVASEDSNGALGVGDIDLEEVSAEANLITNLTVLKDRYGFFVNDDFHKFLEIPKSEIEARKRKEGERTLKWVRMLKKWSKYMGPQRYEKLKMRCRKGIPDVVRGYAWYHLCHGDEVAKKYPNLDEIDTSQLTPTVLDEIERDIDRTFPRHDLFVEDNGLGQSALRRILRRYAVLDPEAGYCQGMGFLAGLFLTYMVEEEAFYTFYSVLQRPSAPLRLLYLPKLAEIQQILYTFEQLCQAHLPKLWPHLEREGVHPTMFFTEWAMTMFCRGFSFDLVTRVWDIFVLEGSYKIVYRVSLAILKSCEADFLSKKFEKIMGLLREIPQHIDASNVLKIAFSIPLKRAEIEKHEAEYKKK